MGGKGGGRRVGGVGQNHPHKGNECTNPGRMSAKGSICVKPRKEGKNVKTCVAGTMWQGTGGVAHHRTW